jgi:hypothetical protein
MAQKPVRKKKSKSAAKSSKGGVVIWRRPNNWLIAWLAFTLLFFLGVAGEKSNILFALGTLSLTAWAVLELWLGVNLVRRVLGGVVLLVLLGLSKHIFKVIFG